MQPLPTNGDGKPDIALSGEGNTPAAFVYQNNSSVGAFSFPPAKIFRSAFAPYGIVAGDLDADNKPELIVSEFTYDYVSVFKNKSGAPEITSFTPTVAAAGTTVTITGSNFTNTSVVSFGGIAAKSFTIVNANSIKAVVDSGASGIIIITNNIGTDSISSFSFAGPPVITSFSPASGFAGTQITIMGRNFNGATAVTFGNIAASSFFVASPTTIKATVATGASGNITVTTAYGAATLAGFTYAPVPVITSFTPLSAGMLNTVTITGKNFTGTTTVSFGDVPAATFTVVSATSITAKPGNGASGSVSVTNTFGTASLSGFIFIPPPVITSFTPQTGASGATVTIKGSGFKGATFVRFEGSDALQYIIDNDSTIRAIVRSGNSGAITIIGPGGIGSIDGFVFIPAPVLTNISPSLSGPGATVTITGTNLNGATEVLFGGIPAASFTVVDSATIIAVVGNGATGTVSVTTPGGTGQNIGFHFTSTPIINSFTPASGPVGTTVTIAGANFDPATINNIVYFGPVRATVVSASSNTLVVTVPPGAGTDQVKLSTTANHLTAISANSFYVTFPGGTNAFNDSSFASRMDFATGIKPNKVKIADIDGDGKPEIIVRNFGSPFISIFKNTSLPGTLSFAPRLDITVGVEAFSLEVTDMNGDGKPDLVISKYNTLNEKRADILVLKNLSSTGNISFDKPFEIFILNFITQVKTGDFNMDGRQDIIAACNICTFSYGNLYGFNNLSENGNLAFRDAISHPNGIRDDSYRNVTAGIDAGDLNNDGRPDVVVGSTRSRAVLEYQNVGDGPSFSVSTIADLVAFDPASGLPLITDLEPDGVMDIVANRNIYKQNIRNLFTWKTTTSVSGKFNADLNGDGRPDLIGSQGNLSGFSILKNITVNNTLAYAAPWHYDIPAQSNVETIGDLDGDGKPDICAASYSGNFISIIRNRIGEALPPLPTITSFAPDSLGYGDSVIITGTNFEQVNSVAFGNTPALDFTIVSATKIVAKIGNGANGFVRVTNPAGSDSLDGFKYRASLPPTITSFTPAAGPNAAVITITGTNFDNTTEVRFGDYPADFFTVVSPTTITAQVGIGSSGNIKVSTNAGSASISGFIYFIQPTVNSFAPASGSPGTAITISGYSLTGATTVTFGGVPAHSFTVNSSTTITAIVGDGASGDIAVTTAGGTDSRKGFTFIPDYTPAINSIDPVSAAKGDTISITGANFTTAKALSFGGTPAASFGIINDSTIAAVVGAGASGTVSLTTNYGTATLTGFIFIQHPAISSFSPGAGLTGTTITITGSNFNNASSVSFGGEPALSFNVVNATTINAVVGNGVSGIVEVKTPGGSAIATGFIFMQTHSGKLFVSPNPAHNKLYVQFPAAATDSKLELVNMRGMVVRTEVVGANTTFAEINITSITPGTYILVWRSGNKKLSQSVMVY